MLLTKNRKVGTLEEDLQDMGLNAEKFLGATGRVTEALQEGSEGKKGWKGAPPVARYGYGPNASAHVEEERQLLSEDVDQVQPEDLAEVSFGKDRKTRGAEKTRGKLAYRKMKAKNPQAIARKKIKARSASVKRKRKRTKKALQRQLGGAKNVAKKHAQGFKFMKRGKRFDGEPAMEEAVEAVLTDHPELRESYEEFVRLSAPAPYSDAACYVEEISVRLSEIFDLAEEQESARVMADLSEHAASLAEDLIDVAEGDLSEDHEARLKDLLTMVTKGIRFYEAMGEPTLAEACAYAEYRGTLSEDAGDDAGDDAGLSEVDDEDESVTEDDDLEEVDGDDGDPGNGELAEV